MSKVDTVGVLYLVFASIVVVNLFGFKLFVEATYHVLDVVTVNEHISDAKPKLALEIDFTYFNASFTNLSLNKNIIDEAKRKGSKCSVYKVHILFSQGRKPRRLSNYCT